MMKLMKFIGVEETIDLMKAVIDVLYRSREFGGSEEPEMVEAALQDAVFIDRNWRGIIREDDLRFEEAGNLAAVLFDLLAAREAVMRGGLADWQEDRIEEMKSAAALVLGLPRVLSFSEELLALQDATGIGVLIGKDMDMQLGAMEWNINELRSSIADARKLSADLDFAPKPAKIRILRAVSRINMFRFFQ
jgi:hypothetical protein